MVYVFLADGFEEVEALTPVDYLRRASAEVQTIGVRGKMVRGARGITVIADGTMYDVDVDKIEMIVLPGGLPGTTNLEKSALLQKLIAYCVEKELPIGAICAAPSILGHLGLLKGRRVTSYPSVKDELEGAEYTGAPTETDGPFITGLGAGAANQFAFALVRYLLGEEKAAEVAAAVKWQ